MDFEKYAFKMNLKACCLFEQLTGRNFLKMETEDDLLMLLYCCVVANNESLKMTFDVFRTLITDRKVAKWINREYERTISFNSQMKKQPSSDKKEEKKEDETELTMTDVASTLIVRYGVDAHYVMYDMDFWEIQPYLNAADIQRKYDLVTQRFWTYMLLSPNINTKKCKSPEELVPFDWEKNENKVNKELQANAAAAFKFLTGNKEEEKKDE